ncbi:MAG: zinc-dependent metalloprotease [Chitinophagales bacterium]
MKRLFTRLLLCAGVLGTCTGYAENLWQQVDPGQAPKNLQVMHPSGFLVYTLDEPTLKLQMWNLSANPNEGITITLPMPDGSFRDFIVWQTPMMPDDLAARYPDIKTFTGRAANDQRVTAKMEFTLYGFTAMIYDRDNTSFVDPFDNYHDGFYMVHYKRDETRAIGDRMKCLVKGEDEIGPAGESMDMMQKQLPKLQQRTSNGYTLRTYRLALSADHFYCQAATGLSTPTIAQALAKMTISMNRINGVYNHEFSVQMNFCSKEDTLIWPTNTGSTNGNDPFNTIDNNGGACLSANQTQCTNRVGSANYDIGHVFTTGGGGISSLGVVCNNGQKAQSCTGSPTPVGDGFDIDYVAHEMGHEYGSEHTFNNNNDGSCGGNAVSTCAYEPGSGGTIMDYAGICSPDDLQMHSNSYFSASSLVQIQGYLAGSENACAVSTATNNKLVYLPTFSATYTIPYKTPFELIGPVAVDSVADTAITYGWTQYNLGDFGKRLNQTFFKGPIFRSYNPAYNPTRVFPKVSMVLAGVLSNAGTEGNEGEKAPDTARYMTFRMVVRDMLNGNGCFLFPDDSIHINAVQTSTFAGFKVTSQGTAGISYIGGSTQTVTWNVVGTNAAPVSAANVDIYLSHDGGNTWPDYIGNYPNTGTASITLPNPAADWSSTVRFKVKGSGNVFFNINSANFTITYNSSLPVTGVKQVNTTAGDIKIFPIPATNILHITTGNNNFHVMVCNSVGQTVWQGEINGKSDIQVNAWAKGVYYIRFADMTNGNVTVKSCVIR